MSWTSSPSPEPRWGTPRRLERETRGPLLCRVAQLLGWTFHPWQAHLADVSLEVHASGVPYYRTVGVSVARQNGKTLLLLARIAMELFGRRRVVAYTSQDRLTARRKWEEMCRALVEVPSFAKRVVHFHTNNGQEELLLDTGSRFIIVTPNEKAGRSLSIDLAIIDEAWHLADMRVAGALGGTMAARTHAQLWVVSNAGTQESRLFRHYTETGRAQVSSPASPMCWMEYAAPDDAEVLDHASWRAANPSLDLPHGVLSSHLEEQALALEYEDFAREYLNLWIAVDVLVAIDAVTWAACRDDQLVPGAQVCLALDLTPERDRGALVAAGLVGDRTPLEVIEHSSDMDRLVSRTIQVASAAGALVVLDRANPASSAVPALERAGVEVRMISAPDFARACGDFQDAARHGHLAHRGDYRLADAVLAATKRAVGDGWVWRRRGPSDISPLVAATLARWGVVAAQRLVPTVW